MADLLKIKSGSLQTIGGVVCGINPFSGEIVQLAEEHAPEAEVKARRKRKAAASNGEDKKPRQKRGMGSHPLDAPPAEVTSD